MRNVSDAIANVLSCFDALIEVLRLQKQTMLVVRLTAIAECGRGMVALMDRILRYSHSPYLDVRSFSIDEIEE